MLTPRPAHADRRPVAVQRSAFDEFAGGCGVCLDPMTAGIRAHEVVSAEFRRGGSFRLTDLPTVAPEPGDDTPSIFTPRPDFVALSPGRIDVGELKPPLSAAKGFEQAAKYKTKIKEQFPGQRVNFLKLVDIGVLTYPNPESPDCPKQRIGVTEFGRGLFVYVCDPSRRELRAANPENCKCGKKKKKKKEKEKPQESPVPVPPPLPSPDVIRRMIEVLEELFQRRPGLTPQPAQPPLFIPKFKDCPFTDPIQRGLFCIDGEGPVASFCTPHDEAVALGFGQARTTGVEISAAAAPAPEDPAEFAGLTRGDGLSPGTEDRRPRVKRLQDRLNELGGDLSDDGKFGAGTAEALHRFQQRNALTTADVVDRPTAESLAQPREDAAVSRLDGLTRGDGINAGTAQRRPQVRQLQERLSEHQFSCALDGRFGPQTLASLNGFQDSRRMESTDIVTPETADALEGRGGPTAGACAPGTVLTTVLPPELSPTKLDV